MCLKMTTPGLFNWPGGKANHAGNLRIISINFVRTLGAYQLDLDASIFHWEDPWLQRHISVVSLVPMFRSYWDFEPISFFVGLGIGIAALDREIWMDRELGSHLQFEDKAEVGVRYKSHQIAIGISHFSNANLADINHGVNVVQLSYAHYF